MTFKILQTKTEQRFALACLFSSLSLVLLLFSASVSDALMGSSIILSLRENEATDVSGAICISVGLAAFLTYHAHKRIRLFQEVPTRGLNIYILVGLAFFGSIYPVTYFIDHINTGEILWLALGNTELPRDNGFDPLLYGIWWHLHPIEGIAAYLTLYLLVRNMFLPIRPTKAKKKGRQTDDQEIITEKRKEEVKVNPFADIEPELQEEEDDIPLPTPFSSSNATKKDTALKPPTPTKEELEANSKRHPPEKIIKERPSTFTVTPENDYEKVPGDYQIKQTVKKDRESLRDIMARIEEERGKKTS